MMRPRKAPPRMAEDSRRSEGNFGGWSTPLFYPNFTEYGILIRERLQWAGRDFVSPTPDKIHWPGLGVLLLVLAAGGTALFFANRGPSAESEEAAVRNLLTSLGPISAALDAERFADRFSPDDILARIKKDGPIEGVSTPEEEKALLTVVRQNLIEQVTGMKGTGSLWTSVRPTHLQVTQAPQ